MNKTAVVNYLNAPIPRWLGLVATGEAVGMYFLARYVQKKDHEVIGVVTTNNAILSESVEFLMSKADNDTIAELNEKLDYWRAVKGIPTETAAEQD